MQRERERYIKENTSKEGEKIEKKHRESKKDRDQGNKRERQRYKER